MSAGKRCEKAIDECASKPCQNAGVCRDIINGYTCACALGYKGDNCEFERNECKSNPCKNRGACTDLANAYKCLCRQGFTGRFGIPRLSVPRSHQRYSRCNLLNLSDESRVCTGNNDFPYSGCAIGSALIIRLYVHSQSKLSQLLSAPRRS